MNFRIIDTSAGPMLLYRDQDENGLPCLVCRMDTPDNTIVQQMHGFSFLTVAAIQRMIETFSLEKAEMMAHKALQLWCESPESSD